MNLSTHTPELWDVWNGCKNDERWNPRDVQAEPLRRCTVLGMLRASILHPGTTLYDSRRLSRKVVFAMLVTCGMRPATVVNMKDKNAIFLSAQDSDGYRR